MTVSRHPFSESFLVHGNNRSRGRFEFDRARTCRRELPRGTRQSQARESRLRISVQTKVDDLESLLNSHIIDCDGNAGIGKPCPRNSRAGRIADND
jgi:hypothetical protein